MHQLRKLCGSMSAKRCLLILPLLALACLLQAQSAFSLHSAGGMATGGAAVAYFGNSRLAWQHRFSPSLDLRLSSDLHATDRPLAPTTQKLWHIAELEARYHSAPLQIRAGYRNLAFGSSQLLGLYPAWVPAQSQKRLLEHQAGLAANWDTEILQAAAYAQAKHLRYTPYELDLETFELLAGENTGVTDLYSGLNLQLSLPGGLSARVALDHKDGIFADAGIYRLTNIKAGLAATIDPLPASTLSASFDVTNRQGDAIPHGRRNLLETRLRYRHRFNDTLAGYLLWINNSCLNGDLNRVRLVSNYLRAQLKYSFVSDPSGGSYVIVGAKYSPENEADAWFASGDYRLWNRLYSGLEINCQPGRALGYGARLSYYYIPVNEIYLRYLRSENEILNTRADYWGLGTSLYW